MILAAFWFGVKSVGGGFAMAQVRTLSNAVIKLIRYTAGDNVHLAELCEAAQPFTCFSTRYYATDAVILLVPPRAVPLHADTYVQAQVSTS